MKQTYCNFLFVVALLLVLSDLAIGHTPTPTPDSAGANVNTASNAETKVEAAHVPMNMPMNIVEDFPNYHPLVVHFPIVLLIFAGVFQILAFFVYRNEFSIATLILLALGTVSVWLASNTFHAHPANLPEQMNALFESHELMAKYTWWLALAALAGKVVSHFFIKRKWWSEALIVILLVGAAITVSIAGHHGAQLVHMGGVGPQGNYLESH
jgi:uncharacterized membrane protein